MNIYSQIAVVTASILIAGLYYVWRRNRREDEDKHVSPEAKSGAPIAKVPDDKLRHEIIRTKPIPGDIDITYFRTSKSPTYSCSGSVPPEEEAKPLPPLDWPPPPPPPAADI